MRKFWLLNSVLATPLALMLVVGLFAGCGRKTEEAIAEKAMEKAIAKQTGGKANVDLQKDTVQIQTAEGKVTVSSGGNVKVPDSFPKDVPVYPGALVKTALELPEGHSLGLTTKDPVAKVAETYLKQMPDQGWTKEMSMDMEKNTMLIFKKNERTAHLTIISEEEGTQISLSVMSEKKKD